MKTYYNPERLGWKKLLQRPEIETPKLNEIVQKIFSKIEKSGDKALYDYTLKFDQVKLDNVVLDKDEIEEGTVAVTEELKNAIQLAADNIKAFHEAQQSEALFVETATGVSCWQESRPIQKIGIYIPGGTAPLFSTVLMLGIPAKIAGCKEIVLCTPPNKEGNVDPAIIYTASLIGITKIIKVGGIQAVAALTIGTESVPKVYKIFGPGNQYVTAAKQYAQQLGVAIDMPAGPSELLVTADNSSDPDFIASDLLSQAEHGIDSQVICLVSNEKQIEPIQKAINDQLLALPRKNIAEYALENSKIIVLNKQSDRIDFINAYAPEHLIIVEENAKTMIAQIENAGSVFIGNYTPESAGDYASGTNHTLPTNGFAKNYSGVNMDAFIKKITFQNITEIGIKEIGKAIEVMASAEGLDAHKNAVSIRLKKLNND